VICASRFLSACLLSVYNVVVGLSSAQRVFFFLLFPLLGEGFAGVKRQENPDLRFVYVVVAAAAAAVVIVVGHGPSPCLLVFSCCSVHLPFLLLLLTSDQSPSRRGGRI